MMVNRWHIWIGCVNRQKMWSWLVILVWRWYYQNLWHFGNLTLGVWWWWNNELVERKWIYFGHAIMVWWVFDSMLEYGEISVITSQLSDSECRMVIYDEMVIFWPWHRGMMANRWHIWIGCVNWWKLWSWDGVIKMMVMVPKFGTFRWCYVGSLMMMNWWACGAKLDIFQTCIHGMMSIR